MTLERRVIGGGVAVYRLDDGVGPYWIAVIECDGDPDAWDATGMPAESPEAALASLI